MHSIKSVLGGKVDVFHDVGGVGCMFAVGFGGAVVCLSELYAVDIVGVSPCGASADHVPPHSDVFSGFNPAGVFYLAGLVQIERDARGEDVFATLSDDDGAPW